MSVLVQHMVQIKAPRDVVWDLLVDKIRRPDKYVPGVKKVEIVKEHGPLAIERKMHTDDGAIIHEIISGDELTQTVTFKGMPGPKMRGYVTNALFEEDGEVWLCFTINWMNKADPPTLTQDKAQQMVTGAVEHTKQLAEERAAAK